MELKHVCYSWGLGDHFLHFNETSSLDDPHKNSQAVKKWYGVKKPG